MTLDDLLAREAIRHTLASYNMAGDRLKLEDFLAVFTEDAILESAGASPGEGFRCEGREAIRRWMTDFESRPSRPPGVEAPRFVRHHLTTSRIELEGPDRASARTYFHVLTQIGPDHAGYYVDVLRRTGERWLIAERRIRVDWRAPDSLFRTRDETAA
jgi:hypothetical protein